MEVFENNYHPKEYTVVCSNCQSKLKVTKDEFSDDYIFNKNGYMTAGYGIEECPCCHKKRVEIYMQY